MLIQEEPGAGEGGEWERAGTVVEQLEDCKVSTC